MIQEKEYVFEIKNQVRSIYVFKNSSQAKKFISDPKCCVFKKYEYWWCKISPKRNREVSYYTNKTRDGIVGAVKKLEREITYVPDLEWNRRWYCW